MFVSVWSHSLPSSLCCRRKQRYQSAPRNIHRHVLLSEIKEATSSLPLVRKSFQFCENNVIIPYLVMYRNCCWIVWREPRLQTESQIPDNGERWRGCLKKTVLQEDCFFNLLLVFFKFAVNVCRMKRRSFCPDISEQTAFSQKAQHTCP